MTSRTGLIKLILLVSEMMVRVLLAYFLNFIEILIYFVTYTAQYITSLCFYPAGSYLTVGLNSGEVKSFKGLPSSLNLVASLTKPQVSLD